MNPSDITSQSIVTLSDFLTLRDANETGASVSGVDMSVIGKRVVHEQGKLCSWHLFNLESQSDEDAYRVLLCLKVVDNEIAARVYESPEWFENGSRQDLDDADVVKHMFDMPKEEGYPSDAKLKKEIVLDIGAYHQKMQTLYGEVTEDNGEHFCAVTEYHADVEDANNELMVVETGGFDEDGEPLPEGGFVELLMGREINVDSDIKIL
jgi:hypothetical protein